MEPGEGENKKLRLTSEKEMSCEIKTETEVYTNNSSSSDDLPNCVVDLSIRNQLLCQNLPLWSTADFESMTDSDEPDPDRCEIAEYLFSIQLIIDNILKHVNQVRDLTTFRLLKRSCYRAGTKKLSQVAYVNLIPMELNYPRSSGCYEEGMTGQDYQSLFFAKLNYVLSRSSAFPCSRLIIHPTLWKWGFPNVRTFLHLYGYNIKHLTLGYKQISLDKLRTLLQRQLPNIESLTIDSTCNGVTNATKRLFPEGGYIQLPKLKSIHLRVDFRFECSLQFRTLMKVLGEIIDVAVNLERIEGTHPYVFPALVRANKVPAMDSLIITPTIFNHMYYDDFSALNLSSRKIVIKRMESEIYYRNISQNFVTVLNKFFQASRTTLEELFIDGGPDDIYFFGEGVQVPVFEKIRSIRLSDLLKIHASSWIPSGSTPDMIFPSLEEVIVDEGSPELIQNLRPSIEGDVPDQVDPIESVKLINLKLSLLDGNDHFFLTETFPNANMISSVGRVTILM